MVSEEGALDEGGGDDTLLAVQATEKSVGEFGTSVSHGEGSTSSAVLSLDDLISTVLDSVDELVVYFASDALSVLGLREEGNNRRATVSSNDGNNRF